VYVQITSEMTMMALMPNERNSFCRPFRLSVTPHGWQILVFLGGLAGITVLVRVVQCVRDNDDTDERPESEEYHEDILEHVDAGPLHRGNECAVDCIHLFCRPVICRTMVAGGTYLFGNRPDAPVSRVRLRFVVRSADRPPPSVPLITMSLASTTFFFIVLSAG